MRLGLASLVWVAVLSACVDPAAPGSACDPNGPDLGMPAFDLVGALRAAGATVVDRGTRLDLKADGPPTRVLEVEGQEVELLDYPCPSAARDYVERFSPDASTYLGVPTSWPGAVHIYWLSQAVATYVGDDLRVLDLLRTLMGPPVREGVGPAS